MSTRPSSTYRLQIRAGFDLREAAKAVDYFRELGVGWLYLSPLLMATAGSDHGYDVVDPTRIDPERGGEEGLAALADAAHAAGLGVLLDIVPNHMGVQEPAQNPWWWDVLRRGRGSEWAEFFDIDWAAGDGRVVLPILGGSIDDAISAGDVTIDAAQGVVRLPGWTLPLADGSVAGAEDDIAAVLARQHWRAIGWREDERLNYRRFFAVNGLAAVRVEEPDVFEATHDRVLRAVREGQVDGLRVDHPDGLADPGGYLAQLDARLRSARPDAEPYVLVEKILEPGEELPSWWATAGTTGYDALGQIDRVLVDPRGAEPLAAVDDHARADTGHGPRPAYADVVHDRKRHAADELQRAEVGRLIRLLPESVRAVGDSSWWRDVIAEVLAAFPVYRAYLPAGSEHVRHACEEAIRRRPELERGVRELCALLEQDPAAELTRRFMQTTGPVMAKGVEDSAFYRDARLSSLNEVGADPALFALSVSDLHAANLRRQAQWPEAMTTLSTHDTKRSEDVRARLAVLAEVPRLWGETLEHLREHATTGNGSFDDLLWQAIVGAWPTDPDEAFARRLHDYAVKAARESGEDTRWSDPDKAFEERMHALVDVALGAARPIVESFVQRILAPGRSNALAAKLLQLAGPGIPDVYEGTERWELSLVDPDNRRPIDVHAQRALLARVDEEAEHATVPRVDDSAAAKMLVVSRVLRLRRDHPERFRRYRPVTVLGAAASHAIAFDRGGVVAIATRLPVALAAGGGWRDTTALVAPGRWRDALTGRVVVGGPVRLLEVLEDLPVAVLVHEDADDEEER